MLNIKTLKELGKPQEHFIIKDKFGLKNMLITAIFVLFLIAIDLLLWFYIFYYNKFDITNIALATLFLVSFVIAYDLFKRYINYEVLIICDRGVAVCTLNAKTDKLRQIKTHSFNKSCEVLEESRYSYSVVQGRKYNLYLVLNCENKNILDIAEFNINDFEKIKEALAMRLYLFKSKTA